MKTKAEIQKAGTKDLILGCRKLVFATADTAGDLSDAANHLLDEAQTLAIEASRPAGVADVGAKVSALRKRLRGLEDRVASADGTAKPRPKRRRGTRLTSRRVGADPVPPARPDDWGCPACGTRNLATRTACLECFAAAPTAAAAAPRPLIPPAAEGSAEEWECGKCQQANVGWRRECVRCGHAADKRLKAGDWLCAECGGANFASRTTCFACDAGLGASVVPVGQKRPTENLKRPPIMKPAIPPIIERREGDWCCAGCGTHNFAFRDACHGCRGPRTAAAVAVAVGEAPPPAADPPLASASGTARKGKVTSRGPPWRCPKCHVLNPFERNGCTKCHGDRDRTGMRPGDWVCGTCRGVNFQWKRSCDDCHGPRPPLDGEPAGQTTAVGDLPAPTKTKKRRLTSASPSAGTSAPLLPSQQTGPTEHRT